MRPESAAALLPARRSGLCLPLLCRRWRGETYCRFALLDRFSTLRVSSSFSRPSKEPHRLRRSSKPPRSDRKLEFSFDFDELVCRATADFRRIRRDAELRFRQFATSAEDAYNDLRTSVRIEGGRRITFSCNRSSLLFVADMLLLSALAVVLFRVLAWLVRDLGRVWGLGSWGVVRRDRSLGGREVVVGRRRTNLKAVDWRSSRALRSPLSPPRGDETRTTAVGSLRGIAREEKLPEWWPDLCPGTSSVPRKDELQKEANRLVRAIMDNRMSGKDYKEEDMIQLRRLCRSTGLKVSFSTTNARDSFYRASVEFVLNACSRVYGHTCNQIDGEDARHFIAGLADNIGLVNIHAVRILRGSVAASARSHFLQAWSLDVQGQRSEALDELAAVCHIFRTFPPDDHAPELEMVAGGLERILTIEQRAHLLNLFGRICESENQSIAAAALGIAKSNQVDVNDITSTGSRA